MTPRDFSQVPVEQLAHLLLERARHDPALPRRTPANSNEAPPGWQAPAVAEPCRPWFPERLAEQQRFPGQDRLEALVTQAMVAAQEAEEIAEATRIASRRANRGAAIAIALGVLGVVTGISAGFGNLRSGDGRPQLQVAAETNHPMIAPASAVSRQPPIATQPVADAVPAPDAMPKPETTSAPDSASDVTAPPALAPATFVRVLPAMPSRAADEPPGEYQPYATPPAAAPHPARQPMSRRVSLNHAVRFVRQHRRAG